MLQKENFRLENIQRLQKNYKKDPALLERVVYAFGLLEALCLTGLPLCIQRRDLPDAPAETSYEIVNRH